MINTIILASVLLQAYQAQVYQIPNLYKRMFIQPQNYFQTEKVDSIYWTLDTTKDGNLTIYVKKLHCMNDCITPLFVDKSYLYRLCITVSKFEYPDFAIQCDNSVLLQNNDHNHTLIQARNYTGDEHRLIQETEFVIKINQIKDYYYVYLNVMATVEIEDNDHSELLSYPYTPASLTLVAQQVVVQNPSILSEERVLLAGVLLAVILVVILLFWRHRQLKSVLKYEQSDMRNVARIEPSQGVELNHTSLFEEK